MTAAPMKITALAPWFGSKRTLAPAIIQELGEHSNYFEPFCGSMAVLLAKPPARQETVNDLHCDLTNLARVLAREESAAWLYGNLSRVMVSDGLLADAHQALKQDADFTAPNRERAMWYFLQSWTMRNGVAGTNIGQPRGVGTQLAVRYTANGGSPAVRFRNAVESIPDWHERLRNVVVLNRDAFVIIPKIDDVKGTAVYVDSPYVAESRSGFKGAGAQSRYLHEFSHAPRSKGSSALFEQDDHARLASELKRFKHGRVVVSYYDCDRVRELYAGWTFIDHARQKNLHNQNGRGERPKEAPEILIINGPSYTANQPPTEQPA